jgi:hypothetical protein
MPKIKNKCRIGHTRARRASYARNICTFFRLCLRLTVKCENEIRKESTTIIIFGLARNGALFIDAIEGKPEWNLPPEYVSRISSAIGSAGDSERETRRDLNEANDDER